jgi:FtsP/CotA-like multicopper oxidase with cupredoxin domain
MKRIKFLIFMSLILALAVPAVSMAQPSSPTDETKVPHYFGPYPNWALSPLPVLDANGNYFSSGIKKFKDPLPGLCNPVGIPACPTDGSKYIPLAVPDTTTYPGDDYYEIGLVQYRENMHSDLPDTLLRGYVQLSTSKAPGGQVALTNATLAGGTVPINGYTGVTKPSYLGPVIVATKERPVRILFRNLLPTGSGGDLFLPVDSSMMGSGMGPMSMTDPVDAGSVLDAIRNPMCTQYPKSSMCFKDNRATLHLHGGITPWISDGTPHQWITPAGETTSWPEGVSVKNVPDMSGCDAANDGCQTFYYTNQQSARLMFYHDHAWGITRLNVYAGEAAGYVITDDIEKKLVTNGTIPGATDTIPLIIQDRTFVPDAAQLAAQDPTWDTARWGGKGNLWYHHVYMPAQNPGDASGMSAYGRWMYGPWFWPPATPIYGPISNPYYNASCNINDSTTWQYQVDPFCEPEFIPGTPNISVGMEQFNDTPIVNGTAYPTVTLANKAYRLRILNAANDRFWNLQWYTADSTGTEVALKAAEVAAARLDPAGVFPTPDTSLSPAGPAWIQIGTEGGFLPAPVVIPNQPTTWITDPTRFDVGNVDQHSLLLAPAERADVIVDFSQFAGKTLILYNDAPAAFPARVPSYDYYTGYPDQSPNGPATIIPGYGPNTRTIMQVKISGSGGSATPDYVNQTILSNLETAFRHQIDATTGKPAGVFESGQPPIIVGQAAYNSAYGTTFPANSWCNAPGSTQSSCDGFARISDQGGDMFGFNTLAAPTTKLQIPLQPKAIHDEMNAVAFDEFGRMTANLGVEAVPATPGAQNITLYPYVNPATELIDATNLPKGDLSMTPIIAADGTQLWKITHNGVDTHPIHFHLYDVQVVNRVTWDNIIIPPDPNELGWKDTVRVSPLEDTIVALRPIIPILPFELPNSIRNLNPMMPTGSQAMFNSIDPQGNPTAAITNQLVNFGWEYVYHCHILSHEEMDMMRPVSVAIPPNPADGLSSSITGNGNNRRLVLSWNDNSIAETAYLVQKSTDGTTWTDVGTSLSPLDQPNTKGRRSLTDPATYNANAIIRYRVEAQNTVGYGAEFPSMTVKSVSNPLIIGTTPTAPSNATATLQAGPQIRVAWTDNSNNETGFVIQRQVNNGGFTPLVTTGANITNYTDTTVTLGNAYQYRVAAVNAAGQSNYATTNSVTVIVSVPTAPTNATATLQAGPQIRVAWTDNSNNETGFVIQRQVNSAGGFTTLVTTSANITNYTDTTVTPGNAYQYQVVAVNATGSSTPPAQTGIVSVPALAPAPTIATATAVRQGNAERVTVTWNNVAGETGYTIQWSNVSNFSTVSGTGSVGVNVTTLTTGNIARQTWYFRVGAVNASGTAWSAGVQVLAAP